MKKLLIVEDSVLMLKALKDYFRGKFKVHFARTGKQAKRILHRNTFDHLILDVELGDMNGFELFGLFNPIKTKVVVTTGFTCNNCLAKAISLGADKFVCKPYNVENLIAN